MSEVSKSSDVQVEGKREEGGNAPNSPKTSKTTWLKIKSEYESGTYLSQRQLALKYNVNEKTLFGRIDREGWKQRKQELQRTIEKKIEEKLVKELSQADSYLQNSFKRALRLEKIADASLSQASLTNEGIPLVDLEQVDILTRSELRIHELARSALRIPSVSQLDVTTGGKDLGASFVSAIAKLRADSSTPKLNDSDVDKIIETGQE